MKRKMILSAIAAAGLAAVSPLASAADLKVTITSHDNAGGVHFTPVWVGFHDGSFDSYNGGLSSQPGLEQIAEVGDAGLISSDFLDGKTYIDTSGGPAVSDTVDSGQPGSERIDGSVGGGPIGPNTTVSSTFNDVDVDGANQYFSYVSMVLPSSDYYIANGNPVFHDLSSLANVGDEVVFQIGLPGAINDAGTEVNDFDTSAGNPLVGIPNGDAGMGADQNGVNANVVDPYANFLNSPGGFDFTNLNFNDAALYPTGLATVTISVVPEPASLGLLTLPAAGMLLRRRRNG